MRIVNGTLAGLAVLLVGSPVAAVQGQDANSMPDSVATIVADGLEPIQRRATDIAGLFRADPGRYDEVFAPPFLAQISAASLDQVFTGVHTEHGRATDAEVIGPFTGGASIARLHFEDGTAALVQLAIEPAPPHRVTGAHRSGVRGRGRLRGARHVPDQRPDLPFRRVRDAYRAPPAVRGRMVGVLGRPVSRGELPPGLRSAALRLRLRGAPRRIDSPRRRKP